MKKKIGYTTLLLFILVNLVAYNHAWHFSHFDTDIKKTKKPEDLSLFEKLVVLSVGISNPKPVNTVVPNKSYDELVINSHHGFKLSAWRINVDKSKGTVLLFHGYTGKKSDLITEAYAFNELGYNTVLVDFYGSGNSDGNGTTVGRFESEDVRHVYDLISKEEENIILYGASMGAVAIARAVSYYDLQPQVLILECPYGKFLTTVKNRFELMKVPALGLPELLVFWGGIQNGYWGFSMNTINFARNIVVPTLILHGEDDKRSNIEEVREIYQNLKGRKKLRIFKQTQHEALCKKFPITWKDEINEFLEANSFL